MIIEVVLMKKVFSTEREKEESLNQINLEIEEKLREMPTRDDQISKSKLIMYISLVCCFVLMITYFISSILHSYDMINQMEFLIGIIILSLFTVLFTITCLFLDKKKTRIFVIISSIIFSIYFLFQLLYKIQLSIYQNKILF